MNIIKKHWTKFKKWYEYNKMDIGTWDEWADFDERFKTEAPIRYFLNETIPRTYHIKVYIPYVRAKEFILYRTVRRYHVVNTGLKPGYYDKDDLMLHACFSLLVDFVEIECAHMEDICESRPTPATVREKIKEWFGDRITSTFKNHRNPEAGIRYLTKKIKDNNPFEHEDEHARKVLEIYDWYVNVRPNREYPPDPTDVRARQVLSNSWKSKNPEQYSQWLEHINECREFDLKWAEEDDEMILKVLAVRKTLWT